MHIQLNISKTAKRGFEILEALTGETFEEAVERLIKEELLMHDIIVLQQQQDDKRIAQLGIIDQHVRFSVMDKLLARQKAEVVK